MKTLLTYLFTTAFLLSSLLSSSLEAKTKKTLYIGIDGLVWKGITTENAPNLTQLMGKSKTYTNALAETPTWSSNGWSSLLTATGKAKHNYFINETPVSDTHLLTFPSFFKYLQKEQPDLRTASFVSWGVINEKIVQDAATVNYKGEGDSSEARDLSVYNKAMEELQQTDVAAIMFLHFDDVDHFGHETGFNINDARYTDALKIVDGLVGNLLTAVKTRPTYTDEDWLITVVTDHGGNSGGHGGTSYEEQNAFIIFNNSAVAPELIDAQPITRVDSEPFSINSVAFGTDVYGSLPFSNELEFAANQSFTIEVRMRATATNSDPSIISNKNWGGGGNKGIIISRNGTTIKANLGDGGNRADIEGVVDVSDPNYWHHLTLVIDRSSQKMSLYDAGNFIKEVSISNIGSLASGMNFNIGQDGTGNYNPFFTGNIAEVRIFKSALTPETISAYAFKSLDESHPDFANLLVYNKGNDASGIAFKGSFGKPDITLNTKNSAQITWSDLNNPILIKQYPTEYNDAPYLYNVAPTIFNFMGFPAREGYNWDGKTLINFTSPGTSDDDGLPVPSNDEVVLDNFENNQPNFTFQLNDLAGATFNIMDNPKTDAVNGSSKVLQITRADNTSWMGFWCDLTAKAFANFDSDKYPYVRFKILRTVDGASTRFKFEQSSTTGDTKEILPQTLPSKVNEWEEVIFPIGANGAKGHYYKMGIQPDFADGRTAGTVVYIDDIKLTATDAASPTGLPVVEDIDNIKISFNGNKGTITFNSEQKNDVVITVCNVTGQILSKQILKNISIGVNSSDIIIPNPGVYLLKLMQGNKSSVVKFIM